MKLILFLLIILLALSCCNKNDDEPTNPIDKLPPATQTGANTAGCLLDGEAFLPNRNSTVPLRVFYLDGKTFSFVVSNKVNNISNNLMIFLENVQIEVGKVYKLNTQFDEKEDNQSGEYTIGSTSPPSPNYYTTNSNYIGEIVFTNHDFNKAILSGTYWFDAINSEGKIVKVREGRFDMKY